MSFGSRVSQRSGRYLAGAIGLLVVLALWSGATERAAVAQVYPREALLEDARQLLAILEDNHPDPYSHGGGKLAFYRRFQDILQRIPEDGMTQEAFTALLLPFVAAVGDGHTSIWGGIQLSETIPRGVPLRFEIVEQLLYVAEVVSAVDRDLIGSVLISVEGVAVDELRDRQRTVRGLDNEYNELSWLAVSLWYRPYLELLLPEWTEFGTIHVTLRRPTGETFERAFRLPIYVHRLHGADTAIETIEAGPYGFATGFLDAGHTTAILRVEDMTGYREVLGRTGSTSGQEVPEDVLAATPSATEVFRQLVIDMKDAGTRTLLVDLRNDLGGASLMADILVYFLYGKETLLDVVTEPIVNGGGQIERMGPLEMKHYTPVELAEVSALQGFPVQTGDFNVTGHYDFYVDYAAAMGLTLQGLIETQGQQYLAGSYDDVRDFADEFSAGTYAGYYAPPYVAVLVSPHTYSSGFTLMLSLATSGATLIGTPSAQAANCVGEGMFWELDHTGIRGLVSHNVYLHCPDDPERGRVWPIDVPLTYEYLQSTGFDPNAAVLLALEWIEAQEPSSDPD